ncbi:hypothetical protein GJV26_20570 [Massilia dura]|uniref:Transmembrane protein n=1 Tax=Pseudoduganella dura TaxID=321982 RepID=A0A6I3XJV8_9BURK|nr:hypothetical protein [Pseudoduganella dura]MUI14840.1 hypothetical protein [Pseudoduganella dura]GGX85761.1 hypothetical protein GCM10007386_15900 [Pseudoduganella dura]
MKRRAGLACLLLGVALAGGALPGARLATAAPVMSQAAEGGKGAQAAPEDAKSFDIAIIGHAFPGDSGDDDLQRTLARADREKPAFVIATGIKSAAEPCTDKLYLQRKALLNRSDRPLILVLSGDDWTACRNSAGRSNAIERLNRIREIFYDGQEALGRRVLDLNRQSTITKFRSYSENAYWERGGVLFATINLPSPNNHFLPEAGRNSEYEDRLVANRAWLQRLFGMAKRRKLEGLVLFSNGAVRIHAEPGFSLLAGFSSKQDGFAETRRLARTLAGKYAGKVLLVDTSREPPVKGDPIPGTVTWQGNLGHVTLGGEWHVLRVAPGSEQLFTLHPDEAKQRVQGKPPRNDNEQRKLPRNESGQPKLPDGGKPKPAAESEPPKPSAK